MVTLEAIKKLRAETQAGIMECRKALEDSGGDEAKAKELLKQWGAEKAQKKADRQTASGLIYAYIHHGGKVGVLLEVNCETDFVARNSDFQSLCKELSLQITSMKPENVDKLLLQEYIRDATLTIDALVKEVVAKLGENIVVKRFVRFELGKS